MCDGRLFDAQKRALERKGLTCFDSALTADDTVEKLAARLLSDVPEDFALVGLSMGGIVALELIRQAPERVTHLALLNTTHRADQSGERRNAQLERVRRGELDLVLRDELKPIYMHPANRLKARLDLLAHMAEELGEATFERQAKALMQRRAYTDLLPSIECPTLVLTGEDDAVCPPALHQEMANSIPGARLVLIPQCGHLSTLEQPEAVNLALLELLSSEAHSPAGLLPTI